MSFLGVIVDCNAQNWGQLLAKEGGAEEFQMMVSSILAFCNTHLLASNSNHLLVLGAGLDVASGKLFSSIESESESPVGVIEERLRAAIAGTSSSRRKSKKVSAQRTYVSPVATCICSHQKFQRDYGEEAIGKIVIINTTGDLTSEQNVLMNLFFVANQHSVRIDVASIGVTAPILQQACDITSGSHSLIRNPMQLVQFLMTRGLGSSTEVDEVFESGIEDNQVDYRAACRCHDELVDSGFVCSVCLAVHCQYVPLCVVCNAFFRPPIGKRRRES